MKVQCLYYALDKWNESGGYIQFRKSTHWCMPQVLHLDHKTNRLTHYVPPANLKYPWYSMFGFEGYIKDFDDEDYIKDFDDEDCAPMSLLCMFFGTLALVVFGAIWSVHRLVKRRNKRRQVRRLARRDATSDRRRL